MNDVNRPASGAPRVPTSRGAGGDGAGKPDWTGAGIEPALADVMNDPLVRLVMRRDSLTPDEVWAVVNAARRRLNRDRVGAGQPAEPTNDYGTSR